MSEHIGYSIGYQLGKLFRQLTGMSLPADPAVSEKAPLPEKSDIKPETPSNVTSVIEEEDEGLFSEGLLNKGLLYEGLLNTENILNAIAEHNTDEDEGYRLGRQGYGWYSATGYFLGDCDTYMNSDSD